MLKIQIENRLCLRQPIKIKKKARAHEKRRSGKIQSRPGLLHAENKDNKDEGVNEELDGQQNNHEGSQSDEE